MTKWGVWIFLSSFANHCTCDSINTPIAWFTELCCHFLNEDLTRLTKMPREIRSGGIIPFFIEKKNKTRSSICVKQHDSLMFLSPNQSFSVPNPTPEQIYVTQKITESWQMKESSEEGWAPSAQQRSKRPTLFPSPVVGFDRWQVIAHRLP